MSNELKPYSETQRQDVRSKKPPIGLKPRAFAVQDRALEIIAAMQRYVQASQPIPDEWFDELKDYYGSA